MKKFKGLSFIVCLAVFLAAGSAWAFDATDHVSVAPNGKGDVLIFPAYFTGGGWETKMTVINTSLTQSVVAKVIIRSAHRSQELRDFFIYLSPTDVWTGKLYLNDTDGRPYVWSDDASTINVAGGWASATNPLDIYLVDACPGDTNELGYVEIIQAASFSLGNPKVAKSAIKSAYDAWVAGTGTANDPINVLAGYQEIRNVIPGHRQAYGLNATALKNYDSFERMTVLTETLLGQNANNNIIEIEAALSKNNIAIPYYASPKGLTLSTFTFPTKMAGFPCAQNNWRGLYAGFPSPLFSMRVYDLEENTIVITPNFSPIIITQNYFPQELNFIAAADLGVDYSEGWYLINLPAGPTTALAADNLTSVRYSGAPIIATSMRFDANGQGGWSYVAHDLGTVWVDGVEDMNYHYWGQVDN